MEEEKVLSANNKLLSFGGVLGRREFILNYSIVSLIATIIITPIFYYMLVNPDALSKSMSAFMGESDYKTFYFSLPFWTLITYLVCWVLSLVFFITNVPRRLADIYGQEADWIIYTISTLFAILSIASATQKSPYSFLVTVALIILMAWKGKVTGAMPEDPVKKFNWGAFCGTWIWGLINKSYKTLWGILLIPTLAWFPFALYCGIKGNEWAYENRQWEDLKKFHNSQSNQATFWLILAPFMFVVIQIAIVIIMGIGFVSYAQKNPEAMKKVANSLESTMDSAMRIYFTDIKLTEKENQFYMDPYQWKATSANQKMQLFKDASNYAKMKNNKGKTSSSSYDEFEKTKIYSNYNGELLAEYSMSKEDLEQFSNKKMGLKEIGQMIKLAQNSFKLNNNPTLPPSR